MKIQSQLPDSASASSVAGARSNQAAQPVQNELPQTFQAQVEFAVESQIRVLLEQVAKMLEHQETLFKLLPDGFAEEPAIQNGVFPLAEEALTNGLPNLLKGSKTAADNLTALAHKAGNAVLLRTLFPEGTPPSLDQAAQTTMNQIVAKDSNFAAELQGLIKQLMSGPVPDGRLLANLREVCRQLLPQGTGQKTAILTKGQADKLLPPVLRQAIPANMLPELEEVLAWVQLADSLDWDTIQPPLSEKERGVLRDLAAVVRQSGEQSDAEPTNTKLPIGDSLKDPPAEVIKNARQFAQRVAEPPVPVMEPFTGRDSAQSTPQPPGQNNKQAVLELPAQASQKPVIPTQFNQTVADEFKALFSQLLETSSGEPIADKLRTLCRELIPQRVSPEAFAKLDEAFGATFSNKLKQTLDAHKLPELRQALVWLKVAESVEMAHLPTTSLQQAEETLKEMAALTQRTTTQPSGDTLAGQKTLAFAFPIYLGEEKKAYPAYIHISQDRESPSGGRGEIVRDTWLRLCLLTENLGLVDLIFHLYGKNMLTIKAGFGEADIADSFRRELSAIRKKFTDGPFTLTDITVTAPATELPLAEPTLGVYDHNGKQI